MKTNTAIRVFCEAVADDNATPEDVCEGWIKLLVKCNVIPIFKQEIVKMTQEEIEIAAAGEYSEQQSLLAKYGIPKVEDDLINVLLGFA